MEANTYHDPIEPQSSFPGIPSALEVYISFNIRYTDVKSNKTWIDWAEIVNGGFIEYKADNKANKKWGL